MFDDSDPRKALAPARKEQGFPGPFCGPEIGDLTGTEPQEQGPGWQAWVMRSTNLVLRVVSLDGTAVFTRKGQLDEYMVFSTDPGLRFTIGTAQGSVEDHPGNHLFILPPGDSRVVVSGKGTVTFAFTTRSADLVALCSNPVVEANSNIPPFQPWPDPVEGFRLRAYDLDLPEAPGQFGRIFRCTTMMVNLMPPFAAARDTGQVSPHHHATFEQISLTLTGDFEHHLRWPWTPNMAHWRDDMRIACASPSITVLPPPAIHTTLWLTPGALIVDLFSPPRMDFSQREGWVRNGPDYPTARTDTE
ncbi:cupin domain-containing protein [Gemmobacter serpentinus]|uniref:hypothetical protein n=1 Tax=Gemmobacter serpentinus TaxID=2652247 RepID=UPI00124F41D4|nr:hypothetical protein [Gemmobacter serpentinus]